MAFLPHTHTALARPPPPLKRRRRTATSVLAGDFDYRPPRDILTSLLNGVKPYRPPLTQEELREKELRREKRREREKLEEAERARRRQERVQLKEKIKLKLHAEQTSPSGSKLKFRESHGPKDFWSGRPSTSDDGTPDDLSDHSSFMSQPSSTRPFTPPDDEMEIDETPAPSRKRSDPPRPSSRRVGRPSKKKRVIDLTHLSTSPTHLTGPSHSPIRKEPKKRMAHKKGWKGWVAYDELKPEEAPDPSKLIELDRAIVLEDRRTRSGKNFDAIGEGKDTWV